MTFRPLDLVAPGKGKAHDTESKLEDIRVKTMCELVQNVEYSCSGERQQVKVLSLEAAYLLTQSLALE